MFVISFHTAVLATAQILLLGLLGYLLVKKGAVNDTGLNLLTTLLINIFLPAFMFSHFTQDFRFSAYPNWWLFPLIGFGFVTIGLCVGYFVRLFMGRLHDSGSFLALIAFQNSGYIPLILVKTMLSGESARTLYVYIFLLLIGFNVAIWSLGVWLLTRRKIQTLDLKNIYANPPLIAIAVSLVLVALGLNRFIPNVIIAPVKMLSDCVFPLAMIVIGGNLARIAATKVKKEIAAAVFAKLVLMPLVALGIIWAFKIQSIVGFLIMLQAIVPTATTLSIISRHYKTNDAIINQGIFYSHIFSIITMPVFLMFYSKLVQVI